MVWTEKVHGTNLRVNWDGQKVTAGGKTHTSLIFTPLRERLDKLFYGSALERIFGKEETDVTLFGEGFGAKTQEGGGNYIPDGQDFVLFDVSVNGIWIERSNVEDIGHKLELQIVPVIGWDTLPEAVELTRVGFNSKWGEFIAEGLVMRPDVELLDRFGNRVITKIKHKDFEK